MWIACANYIIKGSLKGRHSFKILYSVTFYEYKVLNAKQQSLQYVQI